MEFVTPGAGNIVTNQVSVGASATLICANRNARMALTIVNNGSTAVYLGADTNVLTTTGVLLPGTVGASFTFDGSAAVWGITAGGSVTVSYVETF